MSVIFINPYRFGVAYDADAQAYFDRVEGANGDNQPLETAVKDAINAFVVGCKADGIWNAIKASCILAGARTVQGALVPLVGTAPTNFNFVEGDYNRKTGLVGDGSTKYLDSNRNNNADLQDNAHMSVYATTVTLPSSGTLGALIGCGTNASVNRLLQLTSSGTLGHKVFNTGGTPAITASPINVGFHGATRFAADSYVLRSGGSPSTISQASASPLNASLTIYNRNLSNYTASRLAFYSIGESLNLALLDARVTTLINAFAAAIP